MKIIMKNFYFLLMLGSCNSVCCTRNNIVIRPEYRNISFYENKLNFTQLKDRISIASQNVINYLHDMDKLDIYSSYELSNFEISIFDKCFELLPESYKNILLEKVIVIYFVKYLGYGGITNYVFDENDNLYMTLLFNSELLNRTMSEWLNYKENTYFSNVDDSNYLELIINTEYPAFLYLLLHEASHIYDHYYQITPFVEPDLANEETIYLNDFVSEIWENYWLPIEKYNYEQRDYLNAYSKKPSIDINNSIAIYNFLAATPFISIYGSTIWAEDFAEIFSWLYLFYKFNTFYIVNVYLDNELRYSFNPFNNALVLDRYQLLLE